MNKKYTCAKESKLFKKGDILVYVILAVLIAVLFWIFFGSGGDNSISYVEVYHNDQLVLRYDTADRSYKIGAGYNKLVDIKKADTHYEFVIFISENKEHFNTIIITYDNKISVYDANCSSRKDCVYSPTITKANEAIVCVPHKLKIVAIGNGAFNPNIDI